MTVLFGGMGCLAGVITSLVVYQRVFAAPIPVQPKLPDERATIKTGPLPTITPYAPPSSTPAPSEIPTPTKKPAPTHIPSPTHTPTPTPKPVSAADLEQWFSTYSSKYAVDKGTLKRIADCESHTKASAQNGPYGGMFQFATGTWQTLRRTMNKDTNPALRYDAEAAIETAAFAIATRGPGMWPSCGKL